MYGHPGGLGGRPVPPSADSAKTLILIALIFQAFATAILAFIGLLLGGLLAARGFPGIGIVLIGLGVVGVLVAIAAYVWSYRPVYEGRYQDAETATLLLGIVGLFLGGLIIGILYLVAWDKIRDALREQAFMAQPGFGYVGAPGVPYFPAAAPVGGFSPPPPPGTAVGPPMAPAPACPNCHRASTWVAQYGRYYCYQCSRYL